MEAEEVNNEVAEEEIDILGVRESDDADLESYRRARMFDQQNGNNHEQLPAEPMAVDQTSSDSAEADAESDPGIPGPSADEPPAVGDVAEENSADVSSSWTEQEKMLLLNAITIFGDDLESADRLSQIIGTRTPEAVRFYLEHYYRVVRSDAGNFDETGAVALSTVHVEQPIPVPNGDSNQLSYCEVSVSREAVIASVSRARLTVQASAPGRPGCSNYMRRKRKIPPEKRRILRKKSRLVKARKTKLRKRKPESSNSASSLSSNTNMETEDNAGDNTTNNTRDNLMDNTGDIPMDNATDNPIDDTYGEQVKISKDDDSDVDIDIETAEVRPRLIDSDENILATIDLDRELEIPTDDSIDDYLSEREVETFSIEGLTELDEMTANWILSGNAPTRELVLERNSLLPLERWFYRQYFSKNPTTSEENYFRIRNHIVNAWLASKPNYITNSSARQGLRGDVNRLARIFRFLEQIGAVNFGSGRVNYIRPLAKLAEQFKQTTKEKSERLVNLVVSRSERRVPQRKEEFCTDGKGGCTTIHDEEGNIVDTIVVKEKPHKKSPKKTVKLISSRSFTRKKMQRFRVRIHLSALLLMNFHAHILRIEVIGLIGGDWDPVLKIMTISTYQPCRNLVLSETCCDMDPISQVESTELIQSQGFSVLGWFHSHPAFAPEPSEQDISTQYNMQHMMSNQYPCLGIILTPNVLCEKTLNLIYRCFTVEGPEEKKVPYKYRVEVLSEGFDLQDFFEKAEELFNSNEIQDSLDEHKFNKVALARAVTNLKRYLTSRHVHLDRGTCDSIVNGISDIFTRQECDDC